MTAKRARGRPTGHVRLLDDPGRFEVALWLAFTEAGMDPYPAAYLVTFLIASDAPIITESVGAVLVQSSAGHTGPVAGHANRVCRKAREAIKRADESERLWLAQSTTLIRALIKFVPAGDSLGVMDTLDRLKPLGWSETILRIAGRIGASLRSNNFPPVEGGLSRAVARKIRSLDASGF